MSGTTLTISGGVNGQSGIVGLPSNFPGAATTSGSLNNAIQNYLSAISSSVAGGNEGFINSDGVTGTNYSVSGSGSGIFQEISNVNGNTSTTSSGSAATNYTISGGVTDLAVQVPGNTTIAGNSNTSVAVFGANSNVNYSVTNPGAGSIFAAGGANSISLYSTGTSNNETVYSAGNDTVNMAGTGNDYVSVGPNANDQIQIQDANANVTATGAATVGISWDNANSGGTLDFVNNSTVSQTIYSSVFITPTGSKTAPTHVTAFGGAGGGFYVGGQAGNNSLIGGSGVVTLVGGGNSDTLSASSNAGTNYLFAGAGAETLIATSTSGSNVFQIGLNYPGLGQPQSDGIVSTEGSGVQTYFLGNSVGESIFGSNNASLNVFNVVSDSTAGGGTFNIYNFHNGFINLMDGADTAAGSATVVGIAQDQFNSGVADIALSDGTTIKIHGVSASSLTVGTATTQGGQTFIQIH